MYNESNTPQVGDVYLWKVKVNKKRIKFSYACIEEITTEDNATIIYLKDVLYCNSPLRIKNIDIAGRIAPTDKRTDILPCSEGRDLDHTLYVKKGKVEWKHRLDNSLFLQRASKEEESLYYVVFPEIKEKVMLDYWDRHPFKLCTIDESKDSVTLNTELIGATYRKIISVEKVERRIGQTVVIKR